MWNAKSLNVVLDLYIFYLNFKQWQSSECILQENKTLGQALMIHSESWTRRRRRTRKIPLRWEIGSLSMTETQVSDQCDTNIFEYSNVMHWILDIVQDSSKGKVPQKRLYQ